MKSPFDIQCEGYGELLKAKVEQYLETCSIEEFRKLVVVVPTAIVNAFR